MEILKVTNIGIKFKMERRIRVRTQDFLSNGIKNIVRASNEFWALRNISFTVDKGDTIGVIGRNGSGKSTLLRIIAGIFLPDEGEVNICGEVSTLFSLGAGFQGELSGIDNIYLNGVMMGLSKKEIDKIVDKIVDFAELGEHIFKPVKTYSSGMNSRLGFSIAMNIKKDIILIDEILGVGDAAFREKAMKEMSRIIGNNTIIMVSHNMETIKKFANKVVWLNKGNMIDFGEPGDVVKQYLQR